MLRKAPAMLTVLLLALSGCGGDDEEDKAAPEQPTSTVQASTPEPTETKPARAGSPTDLESKPRIAEPTGSPPDKLEIEDIVKGKGRAARKGDTVSVQYVGVSFSNGREFDASWDRGEPFTFELGAGAVIPGWDRGVAGMKEGGRRKLVIPPELGYGEQGQPPDIGPNETLVFVVDLLNAH